jgi:phosphonate transport system substrate-binding protein
MTEQVPPSREPASSAPPTPTTPTPTTPRKRTNPLILLLMAIIPAAAIAWALYQVQVNRPVAQNRQMNEELVYNMVGLGTATPLKLADRFTDADGDLVADPPTDVAQQVDPPTLMFSYVATNEPETYHKRFAEFVAHLSKQTGRPVEYVEFRSPEAQLNALRQGKLHVAGINTGNIPLAVNECGFVPICGLAGETGSSTYQMQIIVPADSPIQNIADLKGRELTLTEPGSNSGFKAPLVLLSKDNGLRPGRDFQIRYSNGHDQSIAGIADKTWQAAAVASDVLKRSLAQDPPRITKEQFRVIYQSEDFPTAGFGYVNNLKPELAAKVKEAFFSFQWKGTGVEKEFAASEQTKFAPISFKNDFALVRRIDDAIRSVPAEGGLPDDPTTDEAPATTTAPTTAAAAAAR